jgi:hypothetical protein
MTVPGDATTTTTGERSVVEALADLIPVPAASQHVEDWPVDEREFYRHGDYSSFTDRARQLDRMRQVKAARAILASPALAVWRRLDSPEPSDAERVEAAHQRIHRRYDHRCIDVSDDKDTCPYLDLAYAALDVDDPTLTEMPWRVKP